MDAQTIIRRMCQENDVELVSFHRDRSSLSLTIETALGRKGASFAEFNIRNPALSQLDVSDDLLDQILEFITDWSNPAAIFKPGDLLG